MTITRDSPEAIRRARLASSAATRDLQSVRKRDGDEAALGHASGMVIAACMFTIFDLGLPDEGRKTVNHWAERLNATLPSKPAEAPRSDGSLETMAARNAADLTDCLWEGLRLLGAQQAVRVADATMRATLRFLVETYHTDHARELVVSMAGEIDSLVAARDVNATGSSQ